MRTIYINGKRYKAKPRFFVFCTLVVILASLSLILLIVEVNKFEKKIGFVEGKPWSYEEWMEEINDTARRN